MFGKSNGFHLILQCLNRFVAHLRKFRRRRKDSFLAKEKGAPVGNRPSPARPPPRFAGPGEARVEMAIEQNEKAEFPASFPLISAEFNRKKNGQADPVTLYLWAQMQRQTTSETRLWPTLAGRLSQPLTSRVEAVRQLQATMPITPAAQNVLKRSNGGSSGGPKKAGS